VRAVADAQVRTDHTCTTAQRRGWGGIKNGELLRLAEGEFDLFIISAQGIQYQQNLAGRRIAILALSTNKTRRLTAAAELIRSAMAAIKVGEFRRLEIP
jgi:hypothetical protein